MASLEFKRVLNFMGFVATMCIAFALVIAFIAHLISPEANPILNFKIDGLASAFSVIANVFAYFITIVAGFCYARSKRNIWFLIAQIIGMILIVVAFVVGAII